MIRTVSTPDAPKAIGPYSQAILAPDPGKGLLFLSGQIPLDPATGNLVVGDIRVQTERVLDNLAAVLKAGGSSFERVVKTTIYLVDLSEFQIVNEIYASRFSGNPPARATVQVSALPRGSRVEIDAIALAGG